jgi:hypothetical protein
LCVSSPVWLAAAQTPPPEDYSGASWDAAHSSSIWSGALGRGQIRRFTYRALVVAPQMPGNSIGHTVWIGYDDHRIAFDRIASTRVNTPRLDQYSLAVVGKPSGVGDALIFTLRVHNTGVVATVVTPSNTLPWDVLLAPGSLTGNRSTVQLRGQAITRRAPVVVGADATLTYTTVFSQVPTDRIVCNRAVLTDTTGTEDNIESITHPGGQLTLLPVIIE